MASEDTKSWMWSAFSLRTREPGLVSVMISILPNGISFLRPASNSSTHLISSAVGLFAGIACLATMPRTGPAGISSHTSHTDSAAPATALPT